MIVLRISAKPLLLAVLAASLAFQTAVADEQPDAGAFTTVTEGSLEDLTRVTRTYAAESRIGALGTIEFGTLETLSRKRFSRYQRFADGHAVFDRRVSHYSAEGSSSNSGIRDTTKTGESGKWELPGWVCDLIDEHCGHVRFSPRLPLFRNPNPQAQGDIYSYDALRDTWALATERAEIPWVRLYTKPSSIRL